MKKTIFFTAAILTAFIVYAQKAKWVKIFDGKTTTGWHNWKEKDVKGWTVVDGELRTEGKSGDLISDKEYGDFELEFEFKVSPKGNSGIIYKVIEDPENKALFASYASGPEFQIIDDLNYPSAINNKQKSGANYDVYAPSNLSVVKPAGEWNKGKLIIKNDNIKHILNGVEVANYTYGNEQWKTDVAGSKFAKWPYATPHHKGKIALQGHNDVVAFRKIRIKEF